MLKELNFFDTNPVVKINLRKFRKIILKSCKTALGNFLKSIPNWDRSLKLLVYRSAKGQEPHGTKHYR